MSRTCSYQYEEKVPCLAWAKKGTDRCRHHPHGTEQVPFRKESLTFLERVVWDALKSSRCPPEHRYQGPGKSLPCRWCRTAHAIILALEEVKAGRTTAEDLIAQLEKDRNWTLRMPVVPSHRPKVDRGCSVCQRKPGEKKNYWCHGCH